MSTTYHVIDEVAVGYVLAEIENRPDYEVDEIDSRYRIFNPGTNDCVWMDYEDEVVTQFTRYTGNHGKTAFIIAQNLGFRILNEYTIQDSDEFHRALNAQDQSGQVYDIEKIWNETYGDKL